MFRRPAAIALAAIAIVLTLPLGAAPSGASPQTVSVTIAGLEEDAAVATAGVGHDAVDAPRRSVPTEVDIPFSMLGLSLPEQTEVEVRTSLDGVTWSDWVEVEPLGHIGEGPDGGTVEAEDARWATFTDPLWVGEARFLQVQSEDIAPADVAVVAIDSVGLGRNPVERALDRLGSVATPAPAQAASAPFEVVSRAQWGADESLRRKAPSIARTAKVGFVHHTAGPNAYGPNDGPAIVRGIYHYHTKALGWSDIGYNLLVDRYGKVYEGRYGGIDRAVIGAHAQGFNTGSFGVSVMGTFTDTGLPAATRAALTDVFAWKFRIHGIDPDATVPFESRGSNKIPRGHVVRLQTMSGHRDVGLTACPGDAAYRELPRLRSAVATKVAQGSFVDIAGSVHRGSIVRLADLGVTSGCAPGRYCPVNEVTRAQLATFLARAANLAPVQGQRFLDVPYAHQHAQTINAVVEAGLAAGYGEEFRPNEPVTRAQMATMIQRALALPLMPETRFRDAVWTPHRDAINAIAQAGITSGCGDGLFCPGSGVTRAQMATFLDRARALGLEEVLAARQVEEVATDDPSGSLTAPDTAPDTVQDGALAETPSTTEVPPLTP